MLPSTAWCWLSAERTKYLSETVKKIWNSTYKTEKVTKIEKNIKVMSEKSVLNGHSTAWRILTSTKRRKDKIFVRNSKKEIWNSTYKTKKVTKIEKNTKAMSEKVCLTGTARPSQVCSTGTAQPSPIYIHTYIYTYIHTYIYIYIYIGDGFKLYLIKF